MALIGSPELWALGTLVALLLVVHFLRVLPALMRPPKDAGGGRRPRLFDLIIGSDNRVSTSKTMAVAWTLVVAFMVIAIGYVALAQPHPGDFLAATFANASQHSQLYLVFLGGPYAAAVLAKVAVTNQVSNGTLQKSTGTPSPADIVADDGGATDVYDLQYALFNLIAIVIVLALFLPAPGSGLPTVPDFVAILTGGAALTYTINKAAAGRNQAALSAVIPATARAGDTVIAYGLNLAAPAATRADVVASTKVTVGGTEATVTDAAADHVTFVVPASAGGRWQGAAQDVLVKTNANNEDTLKGGLAIAGAAPQVDVVDPDPISAAASQVIVRGRWFLSAAPATDADVERPDVSLVVAGVALACPVIGPIEATERDHHLVVAVPADLARLVAAGARTGTVAVVRQRDAASTRHDVAVGP